MFQGGQQSASRPYFGIRLFGPYRKINDAPTFVFVFRNDDRDAARFLYLSQIHRLEGLIAYAAEQKDWDELERLKECLRKLVERV